MLMILTLLRLVLYKSLIQLPVASASSSPPLDQYLIDIFSQPPTHSCSTIHKHDGLQKLVEKLVTNQHHDIIEAGRDMAKFLEENTSDKASQGLVLKTMLELNRHLLTSVGFLKTDETCDAVLVIESKVEEGEIVDAKDEHEKNSYYGELCGMLMVENKTSLFTLSDCMASGAAWSVTVAFAVKSSGYLVLNFSSRQLDLNQCTQFAESEQRVAHRCHPNTSRCQFEPGRGFQLDSYRCCCANQRNCVNASNTANLSVEWWEDHCAGDLHFGMRTAFLVTNCLCILIALVLVAVVAKQRRAQQYGVRGWALMELFSGGAALLYSIVLFEYFTPARSWSCCLVIWFRELGFATFYGAIVLKTYRNLIEYRVRKAHHVYVKEKDLLKYLACALALTATGLLAWTLGVVQNRDQRMAPFIVQANTSDQLTFDVCRLHYWSIAWQLYELAFLLYGLWLCYKARNTTWIERWQFTVAVCLEILVTLTANIIRLSLWQSSSPDTMLTVTFVQIQLTVSVNTVLIIVPKFYYVSVDQNKRTLTMPGSSSRAHPSLAKLRDNLVNGTIDFAEVPIADMNPEDIRAELKRVYMQLRMYKLKNIYSENPHISKRKGGKKSSDRDRHNKSNRRFSIPPSSPPSNLAKKPERSIMEEEKSSMMETTVAAPLPSIEEPSHSSAQLSNDLTVESSPHNVYLARSSVAATKKFQLESDQSVRV